MLSKRRQIETSQPDQKLFQGVSLLKERFEDFLRKQHEIYERFRATKQTVITEGTQPDPSVIEEHSGFLVALRHQGGIRNEIEMFNRGTKLHASTLAYTNNQIHTTVATCGVMPGRIRTITIHDVDDCRVLYALEDAARIAVHTASKVSIEYSGEVLYNQTTVILPGIPNEAFWQTAKIVVATTEGITEEVKGASMAHITLARFLEHQEPSDLQTAFALFGDGLPAMTSVPISLDVGYLTNRSSRFEFVVWKSFPLG